ncbi:ethanolamine utilization protein EutJ [Clostridium sp. PL3]|uniref:Ethanolamine utilization protein EutJ n=1 Tax=Clostridium thailandense TaxID=2794346 RepID=A0A949TQF5_9CLOT|nr:ethanolamine utilization protein EutJ [Clostridium thailandense]MBV7271316.1 ethanolamine utilization protein EutJ [Clostridium thailandense]
MATFEQCNSIVKEFEETIKNPKKPSGKKLLTGVDLGTAFIVLAVMDENMVPIAGAYRYATVVKDGLVVDYMGAIKIVKELKAEVEEKLGCELIYAATAIPPGTSVNDTATIKYVVEGAGFEVTKVLDEPTAANSLLGIKNGAVVDVGGGTTGVAIFKEGKVIYIADEPTGGTHFSLVLAGALGISFAEAEIQKRDFTKHKEYFSALKPVIQKVSSIIKEHVKGHDVQDIYLVGGTCCFTDMEKVIEKEIGIPTHKPANPLYVTPLGIAMNCEVYE